MQAIEIINELEWMKKDVAENDHYQISFYPAVIDHAIEAIQVRNGLKAGHWRMNMLLTDKTALYNCGNCQKCWEAPRGTDLYKAGFHFCPNCGSKMEGSEKQ